jgi:hypothetical protein
MFICYHLCERKERGERDLVVIMCIYIAIVIMCTPEFIFNDHSAEVKRRNDTGERGFNMKREREKTKRNNIFKQKPNKIITVTGVNYYGITLPVLWPSIASAYK